MERYTDADGRRWLHAPHYGVYFRKNNRPTVTLDTQEAAETITQLLNDHSIPRWLGCYEVREIKGIEVVEEQKP